MTNFKIQPPDFFYTDGDGDLCMEWCINIQGALDSWRMIYVHSIKEGVYLIETRREFQNYYRGEEATSKLPELLAEGHRARKME